MALITTQSPDHALGVFTSASNSNKTFGVEKPFLIANPLIAG